MNNEIISQKNLEIVRKEVSQWPKWKRDACNIPDENEQEIEKLSKEICNGCKTRHKCENNDGFCIMSDVVAEWLLNKGYRQIIPNVDFVVRASDLVDIREKAVKDTAKEILKDIKYGIENTKYYKFNPMLVYELETIVSHISQKYGVEVD